MGAPTGNGMHDSARELTEMASTQFAFYGLMNPYTYQRPKITLLPNETGLTVPGGTRVAVVPNGTAPALNPPYLPGQYTEYPAAVQGWAQQALPGGGSGIESGSSSGKYQVGAYQDIKGVEGLDAHHVGQKALMKKVVADYDELTAPAINVPKLGHTKRHPERGIVSRSTKGITNARQLLARDLFELKRVYPDIPNSALKELIDMNKKMYPEMRK